MRLLNFDNLYKSSKLVRVKYKRKHTDRKLFQKF